MLDKLPESVSLITEDRDVAEYRLGNGLKVLLVPNNVAPVVTVMVIYRVGSRNEAVGYTGSTHLLEHLMFKGTPTFNKEKGTQIAATLQGIGASYNATTWYDRTNYFETVPSDQLELAIKLEADRMRNSFIADADRQSEMTVVRNELERGQNDPASVLDEAVYATAFREHPYHHPTIGWRADVEGVPTARLKAFYDTYYHPNNATAIIVGDFEPANAIALIAKYFGPYPPSAQPIPQVYTVEPEQQGERRITIRRTGELALVQLAFRTPAALGQTIVLSDHDLAELARNAPNESDTYALVLLAVTMSHGVTSRLYQALVETQLAVEVSANPDQHRDPGLFNLFATVAPGVEPARVEVIMLAELEQVATQGISAPELEKAKRKIFAQEAFGRDGTYNVAVQLSEAEAIADWRFQMNYMDCIERVTLADVQRVATRYFGADNRTVGHFIPRQPQTSSAGPAETTAQLYRSSSSAAMFPGKLRRGQQCYKPHARTAVPTDGSIHDGGNVTAAAAGVAARVQRQQLDNGAVMLVLPNRATPTFSLRASLRAGSYFEPVDSPGLAAMTAEMLERGTLRRTKLELAHDLESVGAELNFSADTFVVNISARALTNDLQLVLEAIGEQLREPAFSEAELGKLKRQTIAAVQEQQTDTRYRAYERFTNLLYDPSHPFYATPGARLIEAIERIDIADIRSFYEQQYGGRSLIFSIAGDLDHAQAFDLFATQFADFAGPANIEVLPIAPGAKPVSAEPVRVYMPDKANVDIIMGLTTDLRRDSPDYYAALLANAALGESTLSSRLGLRVRDKEGLTYGINSRFRAAGLVAGPWYVGVSVNPNNVDRAIASACEVINDYVLNGVRAEELAQEISSTVGQYKVGLATNRGLARAMWNAEFYNLGAQYLDDYPDIVKAVTIADVNEAVRRYFLAPGLTVVMAGDCK